MKRKETNMNQKETTKNDDHGSPNTAIISRRKSAMVSTSQTPPLGPRIASGSFGAIITALAVTPLEVVKVRQQASIGNNGAAAVVSPPSNVNVTQCPRGCGTFVLNNGLMDCVLPKSSVPYFDKFGIYRNGVAGTVQQQQDGILRHLRRIFKTEGLTGLYAGLRPTLVMSVPNTVLYFSAYDEIAVRLRRCSYQYYHPSSDIAVAPDSNSTENAISTMLVPLISGSMARIIASVVTSPLELLRTRQASLVGSGLLAEGTSPPGILHELRTIVKTDRSGGISTLYKGLAPTLWRDVPFSAIYWLCLENFKSKLSNDTDGVLGGRGFVDRGEPIPPILSAAHAFISGAGAGMIAAFFTTPFDVVKTRSQVLSANHLYQQKNTIDARAAASSPAAVVCDHGGAVAYNPPPPNTSSPHERINMSTFGHMRHIVREEGIASLWTGNQTRMIKVAPACAIMISCYEFGKRVFSTMDE